MTTVTSKPKKAFDIEYSTMWKREVNFLESKGISPTYIKKTPDYGINVYKYKKTPGLFLALADYFMQIENERSFKKAEKDITDAIEVRSPEDVEKALQALGLKIVVDNGQPKFVAEENA